GGARGRIVPAMKPRAHWTKVQGRRGDQSSLSPRERQVLPRRLSHRRQFRRHAAAAAPPRNEGVQMDVQTMLKTAVVLLALTAAGGLLIAVIRFSGRPHPPSWLAMLHGLLAGGGLTLVLYAGFAAGMPGGAWLGLVLLAGAALGGLVLNLGYHWKNLPLPIWLVLTHAAIAAVGLVLLAIAVWR